MRRDRTVLVVSKYPYSGSVIRDIFIAAGFGCLSAETAQEGLRLFRQSRPALIVSDLRMPFMSMSGVDLLRQVRQEDPDAAVILLTGDLSAHAVTTCLRLGAFKVLGKPVHVDELLITAERALERRELLIERRQRLQASGLSSVS
jgi:DNA-binding NtrC family response regulator